MLTMVCGIARTLYIILAIVAGFIALGTLDVPMILLVLGLIAGIAMPEDRYVPAAATVLVLPIVGAGLAHLPAIGTQLNAVTGNLAIGVAGALATAIAMGLYRLAMEGVTGLTSSGKK